MISACSSVHKTGENDLSSVSKESRNLAAEQNASYVTEVTFEQKSSSLDKGARDNLIELLNRAKASGKIEAIKVLSWSDLDYPSHKHGTLPKGQAHLAEQRAEQIKGFLKGMDESFSVDTFNMAERPSSVSKLLNTENAKIKKSLEVAGIAHHEDDRQLPSKSGKAVVMVILKD
jgi:hypothetical protein